MPVIRFLVAVLSLFLAYTTSVPAEEVHLRCASHEGTVTLLYVDLSSMKAKGGLTGFQYKIVNADDEHVELHSIVPEFGRYITLSIDRYTGDYTSDYIDEKDQSHSKRQEGMCDPVKRPKKF